MTDRCYLELRVRGSTFATGLSDASGTVPRFWRGAPVTLPAGIFGPEQ